MSDIIQRFGCYRNKKNGHLYWVLETDAINATNEQNGQRMVIYQSLYGEGKVFVRERGEFLQKFELDPYPPGFLSR